MADKQARTERFTFLCTPDERAQVDELARLLEREASDAVRHIIRKTIAELAPQPITVAEELARR